MQNKATTTVSKLNNSVRQKQQTNKPVKSPADLVAIVGEVRPIIMSRDSGILALGTQNVSGCDKHVLLGKGPNASFRCINCGTLFLPETMFSERGRQVIAQKIVSEIVNEVEYLKKFSAHPHFRSDC